VDILYYPEESGHPEKTKVRGRAHLRPRPAARVQVTRTDLRLPCTRRAQAFMDEQVALVQQALRQAQSTGTGGVPIDIAVARQYGDSTVTMRAQARSPAPDAHITHSIH
jgi:hypothetical protein